MNTEERMKALLQSLELTKTGFAGLDKSGQKVDRREFPEAVPFGKSTPLNIPNPRCIKCENEFDISSLNNSLCPKCNLNITNQQQ
jgi:hypothetical protein